MKKLKEMFKEFLDNFFRVLRRPEMDILPGEIAFFFVLAIVPTISLITYGASILNISTDVIFNFLSNAFSEDLANILLSSTLGVEESGIGFLTVVLISYFIASNGPSSIIVTSNAIYGIPQEGYIRRRLKAIIMTIILILLIIFILIVPVFGNKIVELFQFVDINSSITTKVESVFGLLEGPITWIIIYFFIKILYTIAPNKKIKSKNVGYGAIFTSIAWILITYVYSYYINNFAHYSTFYGSLANIAILMMWIYFLSYAFTIGMALNYRKEEEQIEKTGSVKVVDEEDDN